MTNISQQLCEICGIKRKKVEDFLKGCNRCKYLISDECQRGDNPCKIYYKYVYPDFGKPENFVKLLEIVYKNSIYTGTPIGSFRNTKKSFKECFFERTFKRLEKLGNSYAGKELIQAIKSEEWVYE